MKIKDFLSASNVAIDVRGQRQGEFAAGAGRSRRVCAWAIGESSGKRNREGAMSLARRELATASPSHMRVSERSRSRSGSSVRLKQPIEFDAIDGQPVDIVFLISAAGGIPARPAQLSRRRCAQAEGSRGAAQAA